MQFHSLSFATQMAQAEANRDMYAYIVTEGTYGRFMVLPATYPGVTALATVHPGVGR